MLKGKKKVENKTSYERLDDFFFFNVNFVIFQCERTLTSIDLLDIAYFYIRVTFKFLDGHRKFPTNNYKN